jgi:hypothetical protein
MADMLCTPKDVASLLERDLDAFKTIMLVECGTAVVQEAAGNQRIVQVVADTGEQLGTTDAWLDLPQRPVTAISHVKIDGGDDLVAGTRTGFKKVGSRLWRACGWAQHWQEPSAVTYTWTHGYDVSDPDSTNWPQEVQLARGAVIGLIRGLFDNPTGAAREAIDDYSVAYAEMSAAMDANPNLRAALRRRYGVRAGIVRLG